MLRNSTTGHLRVFLLEPPEVRVDCGGSKALSDFPYARTGHGVATLVFGVNSRAEKDSEKSPKFFPEAPLGW